MQFKVSTFNHPPVVIFKSNSDGSIEHDGIEFRLLDTIASSLNFSYEINKPADGEKWGRLLPNGSWTGIKFIFDVLFKI